MALFLFLNPFILHAMPLDPQVTQLIEDRNSLDLQPIEQCTPDEFRAMMRVQIEDKAKREHVAHVEDREIPGPVGAIPVRIYRSTADRSQGVLVYYHGGGWVGGDLETHDSLCRAIANAAECMVISVDYRLAPEHAYPAAAEDAYAALKWVCENHSALAIDPERIAVGGDSAGGNLAAVVSLMARDREKLPLRLQVLIYPITDCDFTTSSYQECAEGYLLTTTGMKWFWKSYAPEEDDAQQPYASPLRAGELSDVAPALVITAEYDVLRDEGVAYAKRLQESGVPTEWKCYDGMIHGFVGRQDVLDAGRMAVNQIANALRKAFA